MKKLYIKIITIVLSVVFITGCTGADSTGNGGNNNGNNGGNGSVDTTAPVVVKGAMAEELKTGDSLIVLYTVTDDVSAQSDIYVEVKVFDANGLNKTNVYYSQADKTFTPLEEGEYTVYIYAYDKAGNSSYAEHTIGVFDNLNESNPIRLALADTASSSIPGLNTKFYYTAYVKDSTALPEVTFKLLRGGSYEYASEVSGGIDGKNQTFSAKYTGIHFLEATAIYNGHRLTVHKQIAIEAIGDSVEVYGFSWENVYGYDYAGMTVGKDCITIDGSGGSAPLVRSDLSDKGISGGYKLTFTACGMDKEGGFSVADYPLAKTAVVTQGAGEERRDWFNIMPNGSYPGGCVIVTNFMENGTDDFKTHNAYALDEDFSEENEIMISRDRKKYSMFINGGIKAERSSETIEQSVKAVEFTAYGTAFSVSDIKIVKAQDSAEELPGYSMPSSPDFGNGAVVHDPSVFKDTDGRYYAFGSHFATAYSDDLIKWSQYSSDGGAALLYSGDWRTVLSDAFSHVRNASSTWAPDVIKIGSKYYMYYSLSTFGSAVSYIGRVEASSPTGPYSNSQYIIKSNGSSSEPNAIDPALFYDKDGRLWMSYGSFFGGIYIKELYADGANAGLPKEAGYGKLLWGGGGFGPEGPYIFYNAETNYYYLMVSHGSLSTDYNMRVARSANPDGPYVDITGKDMAVYGNSGNKLAGNYQFNGYTSGYAAMGHNSVICENGEYFVVYHTRFRAGNSASSSHSMYVNQLFFNEAGWPVLAPNRYAGESAGKVTASNAAGTYDLLIHTAVGNDSQFATSSEYVFGADGSIRQSSTVKGSFAIKDNYYIDISLNGEVYRGVIVPQWNGNKYKAVLSVSCVSSSGVSLWANMQ